MKLYHGSEFIRDELHGSNPRYSGSLGYGVYLTSRPQFARVFGDVLHEVVSPVPDDEVAYLTDMQIHDCGDSLVLGTPGAAPFTFDIVDRGTGETRRYSVLEQCDLQVRGGLRRWLLEDHETPVPGGGDADRFAQVWEQRYLPQLLEDDEADPSRTMEELVEELVEDEEIGENTADALVDAADALDEWLTERIDGMLGDEIRLDDVSAIVADHGYSAFHIDGYAPGGDEYVIVSDDYMPVAVARVLDEGEELALVPNKPVDFKEVRARQQLVDMYVPFPRYADELLWSLETWPVDALPRGRPMSPQRVRRYAAEMRSGSEPPAIVVAERRPRYDEITGEPLKPPHPYEVWDGLHRVAAARKAGVDALDVYIGRWP